MEFLQDWILGSTQWALGNTDSTTELNGDEQQWMLAAELSCCRCMYKWENSLSLTCETLFEQWPLKERQQIFSLLTETEKVSILSFFCCSAL
jgi:hypothetical protein